MTASSAGDARRLSSWPRRHGRLRLDAATDAASANHPERRVGERDREAAAAQLARASRAGRFGASDLYERRMEALVTARTRADIDRLTGDLDELVTGKIRTRMLRAIAKARAEGRLEFDEFCERTDRCLEPITRARADGLVADLGYRVVRQARRRRSWEPVARRVVVTGLVGGVAGTALVALPTALDLPGGVGQWLPLAVGTGFFSAIGSAVAALAWMVRPPGRAARIVRGPHAHLADPRPERPLGTPERIAERIVDRRSASTLDRRADRRADDMIDRRADRSADRRTDGMIDRRADDTVDRRADPRADRRAPGRRPPTRP